MSPVWYGCIDHVDFDEACFLNGTPEVVHNCPNTIALHNARPLSTEGSQIHCLENRKQPRESGLLSLPNMVVYYFKSISKTSQMS